MRRSRKAVLAMLLAAGVFLAMFAGCGGSDKPAAEEAATASGTAVTSGETVSAPEDPLKDKMEISVAIWDIGNDAGKSDPIHDKLQQDLNISIKPVGVTWEDYHDKINIWSASGELPDVFVTDNIYGKVSPLVTKWATQGVIKAFPGDLSPYPNVQKIFEVPDIKNLKINGSYYFLPILMWDTQNPYVDLRSCLVRRDWMKTLGWTEDPKNGEEFRQLLSDIVNKDPDGNGKKDTYGLGADSAGLWDYPKIFTNPFGYGTWVKEDGKFIPDKISAKQLDYYRYMRQLVAEGLIDRDFAIQKSDEGLQKFISGKLGVLVTQVQLDGIYDKWSKANPDKNFFEHVKYIKTPATNDGTVSRFAFTSYWAETYIGGRVDDKKLDRILRMMDYMNTREYMMSAKLGMKDKDYRANGDSIEITRAKDDKGNFVGIDTIYPVTTKIAWLAGWNGYNFHPENSLGKTNAELAKMEKEQVEWIMKNTTTNPLINFEVSAITTPVMENYDISQAANGDTEIKFILSKDDLEAMWNKWINEENSKGLAALIEEVNAEAAQRGIK